MHGDIYLVAPGGRAGDINLDVRNPSLSNYTITGRVVATDGTPQSGLVITIFERRSLVEDVVVVRTTTDTRGGYSAGFSLPVSTGWDVFVRAESTHESVDSVLLSDLEEGRHTVDLVLGEGEYEGRTEWDRIEAKVTPLLGTTLAKDVPADRLEWLSKRADVFPLHLAAYIQAHRLADGRMIKPESCYAFLRAGLPADLPGLIRARASAWESALRSAWGIFILTPPGDGSETALATEVQAEIEAMRELVVEAAVSLPASGINHRVLFDTAVLTAGEQEEFMELWLARTSLANFWSAVESSPTLGSTKAALFQFTIQAATLVDNHIATLEGLQAERVAAGITTTRYFSAWDYADWDGFLVARSIAAPDDMPGADATEKRQNYARALNRATADAYPTASLRHRIAAAGSPPPNTDELVGFFDDNPEFDINRTNIARWVAANPTAFEGATDPTLARKNLELVQRVHRLTPRIGRFPVLAVLLDEGVESAADVVALSRNEFVAKYSLLFSDDDHEPAALAGYVWDKSVKVRGGAMTLLSKFALGKSPLEPLGLKDMGKYDLDEGDFPELGSVLTNLDYCACEQCRSVFSPAAYLADLLKWVQERGALTELTTRRGDLVDLLLDCDNTNTVLPTIDIINELLEAEFVGSAVAHQTTWTDEELRLHPEHVDSNVYDGTDPDGLGEHSGKAITEFVYPWGLPFSLPDLEARLYLDHLGVPRHELMRRLLAGSSPSTAARTAAALGMNPIEREIIAGEFEGNTSTDDREFWGFAAEGTGTWVAGLAGTAAGEGVGGLLLRAGVGLEELTALLHLTFIDPGTYWDVTPIYLIFDETCALEDAQINNLSAAALDRLHRFVRLQRRTGIEARVLNVLVDDVGGGLDQAFLEKLVDIHGLHERFGVDYDELATWWAATMDARNYEGARQSLYRRRFFPLDIAVPNHFQPFDARGATLFGDAFPPESLTSAHVATILAAAGLSAAEFEAIQVAELVADGSFTFANLTAYYRVASLARALRIAVVELIQLIDVVGIDPFASPASTMDFVRAFDDIRRSRMSLEEIDWLLRHPAQLEGQFQNDAATARMLEQMALARIAIDRDVAKLVDPDGSGIRANLSSILDAADVETAIAILKQPSVSEEAERTTFVTTKFASFTIVATALTQLVIDGGAITTAEERFSWLLREFVGNRRRETLVVDTLASAMGLAPASIRALIFDVDVLSGVEAAFLTDYATEAQVDSGLTREFHATQFQAHDRLAKAAMVVERWAIAADQIAWYSANTAWLDIDALPLTTSDPDVAFSKWQRSLRALDLRNLFPTGVNGHREMADAVDFATALAILTTHTGWDTSSLTGLGYVATQLAWSTTDVFDDELALGRLREVAQTVDEFGVAASVLWAWVHDALSMSTTAEIKQAARARVEESRWPDVARPLRDVLRERQRDALVAAIIADESALELGVESASDLSARLLIDVETSSCMLTTRVVQATASVQAFVHRVQLGLESPLDFGAAIDRWEWMKNYRVWEANRKVFLYPENWIEPDLRRDKTPEFAAFEAALAQGELNEANVERAVAGYIQRLDQISKLEIVASYQENRDRTWVLARGQAEPRHYWVRRHESAWGPWTEVPLQLSTDNVVLVLHQKRVYLFWVLEEDAPDGNVGLQAETTVSGRNVRIAWSELQNEAWSEPQLSASAHVTHYVTNGVAFPRRFHLATLLSKSKVTLRLHLLLESHKTTAHLEFQFDHSRKRITGPVFTDLGGLSGSASWSVVGQRFVEEKPVGTRFVQFPIDDRLLLAGSGFERAVVHQSDYQPFIKYRNFAWYDDHKHKYRIRPFSAKAPKSQDSEASVETLGISVLGPFVGHVPPEAESQDIVQDSLPNAQIIQDALELPQPWLLTPGVKLALLSFLDASKVVALQAGQALLDQSKQLLSAPISQTETSGEMSPTDFSVILSTFHHPYVDTILRALNRGGVWSIYDPTDIDLFRQSARDEPLASTGLHANTESFVKGDLPVDDFDFTPWGAYSQYNWEIFFHMPLLLARSYAREQRFDEAQRWLHTIFHPLAPVSGEGETDASRFWRLRPLVEEAKHADIDQFKVMLGIDVSNEQQDEAVEAFENQVKHWLAHPFDPHAVAAIRPGAYMRATMMKYFDLLLEWADDLFRQDTRESNNEAAILYMLLAELLGPRPHQLPGPSEVTKTWAQLSSGLDEFSNAAIELENWMLADDGESELLDEYEGPGLETVPLRFWYFCYPPNPRMLEYWDRVEDRLWKLRHCQNIQGVTRSLPLFQPPIDPALLVQATAAGLDLASVLGELDAGLGPYRFRSMMGRAMEFCGELRNLGGALLSAIEKRDAEALVRIRAGHELDLLGLVREVRVRQIDEARAQIDTLEASRTTVQQRRAHYTKLISTGWSGLEHKHLDLLRQSHETSQVVSGLQFLASVLTLIPNFQIGTGAFQDFGGVQVAGTLRAVADRFSADASDDAFQASEALTTAQYLRRAEDWDLQLKQSELDLVRVEREIIAARIRVSIAERELANHEKQAAQSKEVDQYFRDKFSKTELYSWMVDELSTLYFQAYQLAFDLAKRAEAAYRHELAIPAGESRIVQFGYWDSLRKGLLAGERLAKDLHRLEKAHMERDVREYELRKTISLAQLDPLALRTLQETGSCGFSLPKVLFDLDHPGHVLRRIRSVSLSIPAVVGPYTTLGARLTLTEHRIQWAYDEEPTLGFGGKDRIATSTAMADAGLFNLDFKDERYLPFEYAGAISTWNLELPAKVRQFDYRTISDVLVSLAYTAREVENTDYRTNVENALDEEFNSHFEDGAAQLFVVHRMFPNQWRSFLAPAESAPSQVLTLPVKREHFPYFAQRKGFTIDSIDFVMLFASPVGAITEPKIVMTFSVGSAAADFTASVDDAFATASTGAIDPIQPGTWTLTRASGSTPTNVVTGSGWLDTDEVVGMLMLVHYRLAET